MNKYSAVIFDLDGTIVDDEEIWEAVFQRVAIDSGIKKEFTHVSGLGLAENWRKIGEIGRSEELAIKTRDEFVRAIQEKPDLCPRPGLVQFLALLRGKGYLLGLATSSYWPVTDLVLTKIGLAEVFDVMTTGEEVANLKPDSEIYRLTCQKLGVEPEETIVFEDSEVGIQAALDAGCEVIKVGEGWDFGKVDIVNN